MKQSIKPTKLHTGDNIATINLSSGWTDDSLINLPYEIGVQRLQLEFGLNYYLYPLQARMLKDI